MVSEHIDERSLLNFDSFRLEHKVARRIEIVIQELIASDLVDSIFGRFLI